MTPAKKYVDPRYDWSFKKIFLTKGHEDVLKTFLNDVLKGELAIDQINKIQPLSKNQEEDKAIFFDVFCTAKDGTQFIIEMQKKDESGFMKRLDFYRSRAIAEQLDARERYQDLVPVIIIAICNFNILKNIFGKKSPSSYFQKLVITGESNKLRVNKLLPYYIILDLPAYKAQGFPENSHLEEWFQLFTCTDRDEDPKLKRKPLHWALDALEYAKLSYNDKVLADKEIDRIRKEQGVLEAALEEGIEKGRAEGREEGREEAKIETAKKMILEGMDYQFIAKITGLSLEEIENLK